jgi:hypothetical protein
MPVPVLLILFPGFLSIRVLTRIEGRPDWASGCRTGLGQGRANLLVATDEVPTPFGIRGSGTAVPVPGGRDYCNNLAFASRTRDFVKRNFMK